MRLSDTARDFLDTHAIAHLATAGSDGAPHVVPLCYARVGEALYFVADDKPKRHGPRRLQRLANIAANPRVALVVDDYDDAWQRLAYLLLHADAAVVDDDAEYGLALAALRRRYAPYRAMSLARLTHPMVRMQPRRWHLWHMVPSA
ncbi:MAG: TIGR03668 family PPOX class F420-dependent oxidoreductase [bacterium]